MEEKVFKALGFKEICLICLENLLSGSLSIEIRQGQDPLVLERILFYDPLIFEKRYFKDPFF